MMDSGRVWCIWLADWCLCMSERRDRAWINNNNIMKYADDVLTGLRVDGSVCLPAYLY